MLHAWYGRPRLVASGQAPGSRLLVTVLTKTWPVFVYIQVVNLIRIEGAEALYHQCLHNIVQIKPECEKWGMPLMIEPLMHAPSSPRGCDVGLCVCVCVCVCVCAHAPGVGVGAHRMKADGERYGVDGDAAKIIPLVRQAVELGILPSLPFLHRLLRVCHFHRSCANTQGPTLSRPIPPPTWTSTTKVTFNLS